MKTTPKDFFLHLGALVALYAAATALINLSFSVINYYFPDALAGTFYGNSVAWPISVLVVLVPILYVLEWLIARDIAKVPEKAGLWVRTWKIYIIIFSAIALVGGDLIALINTYLNGEITSRFVYKIIVILLVGGVVGKYYFYSLFTNFKMSRLATRVHPWFGLALVIAAIIAGFIAVGSPATQRAYRFDTQRVNDLSSIQSQVVNYWQQKEKLPQTLTDLNDALSWFTVPVDPETKASYEYSVKVATSTAVTAGGLSFELCATFSRPTVDDKGRGAYYGGGSTGVAYPSMAYDSSYFVDNNQDNWKHETGRACFMRTIDPDKYKVNNPVPVGKGI